MWCVSSCSQPSKKIARTLLSSREASTITFVDDSAWPALFDSQLDTRRGSERRGDSDEESGGQWGRQQVGGRGAGSVQCLSCMMLRILAYLSIRSH